MNEVVVFWVAVSVLVMMMVGLLIYTWGVVHR
jgi:hypothetical protein